MASQLSMLDEGDPLIALVGATDNPRKYGSIIYHDLKSKGFRVVPVNRHRPTVDGDKAYRDLRELPQAPDIVNIVVPPHEALGVLQRCEELGYTTVWLQPGAADQAVLDYLSAHDFDYLANACIMVQSWVRAPAR